ncbi:MAG: ATP-binding protein [Salinivirgaceae bacterium]
MIKRKLEDIIKTKFDGKKAIIVLGPRQTGKTTLLKKIASEKGEYLYLTGDDSTTRMSFENANTADLKQIIGKSDIVFIDEAQRIKDIGLKLKIIIDNFMPQVLLVSGSSALELASEINEPLTGSKWEYMLYPISWEELNDYTNYITSLQQLEQRMIFGFYPDVMVNTGDEVEILKQLTSSLLYKDLLSYGGIKKPDILDKLLRALALQIGNEVSFNELANLVQVDRKTVQTYIDLLEKAYVIFKLEPFSRNIRSEISTGRKIYFYDNGIRNALISNYNKLELRNDTGALWENFIIAERRKFNEYHRIFANTFFWRTTRQQEIDYIEEREGKLFAFEFKWNMNKKVKFPNNFLENYSNIEIKIIHRENFHEFILP